MDTREYKHTMIRTLLNAIGRMQCDHETTVSHEYELFGGGSYWDDRGEYRPYFEGVEHTCKDCGKWWVTDRKSYRYYIDSDRNLLEKVEREP